ncbi:endonuclease/exonuclease/phosphatase family protein (macronuclear) [Tetrahymena thermophila SB210]|uniref:Endonuclease/exonuclease/phosphatase family protein n=1 Tax=Tetrahymena thermophila (strain SB210) TaxID=312017 RepID=Q22RF5_TETTS|nr:endonuclease/exonuclease/phosphatase family protein [Tetrahymena thermophila SB210]EAR88167.1 endonuclease/exonuclease/phosphatase family protein [Tetrahymena thermophila SB210]|eukprot:XP_001008412.1 endonuclease/exonuclease/phosphatase family protein [Tetrahymena thermophila SB210]
MNINLLKCLKEQEEYDNILKKNFSGNLCPSDYKQVTSVFYQLKNENKSKDSKLQRFHSDLKQLKILTINIAEFSEQRVGLAQLEKIIQSEEVKGEVDIICLTEILAETWNQFVTERIFENKKPEKMSVININGVNYECFINFSKQLSQRSKGKTKLRSLENNNIAGCAVLISTKFKERPHTVMFDINPTFEQQEQFAIDEENYLCLDQEGRIVTLLFNKFCLISIYAPKDSIKYQEQFDIWQQYFINYIQSLQKELDKDYTFILTGDFNIQRSHQTYQNLVQICVLEEVKGISHSFYKQNSQDKLQIDYTFVSANNKLFKSMKTELVQSFDHLLELTKYHIPFQTIFQHEIQAQNLKNPKTNKIKQDEDSEESEDDIQYLTSINNKIKAAQSQISNIKEEPQSQEVNQEQDEFSFLNQRLSELNLENQNINQSNDSQIQIKVVQDQIIDQNETKQVQYNNQNNLSPKKQKSHGIHKQFQIPSTIKTYKSSESQQ